MIDDGMNGLQTVPVSLGDRSYDIVIGAGALGELAARLNTLRPNARVAIVTDDNVQDLHHETMLARIDGIECLGTVTVPHGEASKSFAEFERVTCALLEMGLERGDVLIAFGGGVVGDLAGYVAASLRRGVDFVQIPTSLLAQVDSSVGGKTGINAPQGKNLVGAFHQPILVLIDLDILSTLPERQFRAGFAEVVKYGLLGDAVFFAWLQNNWQALFNLEPEALTHAIGVSCQTKADVVALDEREGGQRALLNLGHTFGHALEAFGGYSDRLLHGEAIAIGMSLAFRYSERTGVCGEGTSAEVEEFFRIVGLPTLISDIPGPDKPSLDDLIDWMMQDKKVERGALTLILARSIGDAFVSRDVPVSDVRTFLSEQM